jgi:hypothetical protein
VIAFFTVWWGYRSVTGLVTLNLPFLPNFSAADSKRWAGLFLLVAFYSVLARAAYWQIVALIRKWNSRSS